VEQKQDNTIHSSK